MANKIIASIDVFEPNQTLLRYGVYAAKHIKAHLSLFNAQHRSITIPYNKAITEYSEVEIIDQKKRIERAKLKLEKIYNQISKEWDYTTTQFHTSIVPEWKGNKLFHLIDEVQDQHPILVMLGVKSDFNLINELIGTPETKLAEQVDCPVLLIPDDAVFSEILTINYLLEKDKPLVEVMKEVLFLRGLLSTSTKVEGIKIIYYFGDDPKVLDKEVLFKKNLIHRELGDDLIHFTNLANENIDESIEQNIHLYSTGLFAFPNRGKSIMERLMSNDNTKRLILKSQIPVLVF